MTHMINVGVLGATGAVGQRFVELLADHPWFNLSIRGSIFRRLPLLNAVPDSPMERS